MESLVQNWIGKIAVVTGAGSGIGAAISEKLVDCGLIVAGLDINTNPIDEMAKRLKEKKGKMHAFKCNITDEVEVVKTLQEVKRVLSPVNVLVNNAGVLFGNTLLDGKAKEFKTSFDVNVVGKCILNQAVIKQMDENNVEGQIININSLLGHYVYDIPNMNVYPATQFAITALSETLRHELIGKGSKIKVTNICPGPVSTKMIDPSNPLRDKIKSFLKPEDVANTVVYILSTPPHLQVQNIMIRSVGEPH